MGLVVGSTKSSQTRWTTVTSARQAQQIASAMLQIVSSSAAAVSQQISDRSPGVWAWEGGPATHDLVCTWCLRCRYAEAEKTNGRWAMMAVAGIMGQELLGVTPEWWNAGAKDYGVPMAPLTAIEFLVSSRAEGSRATVRD